MPASRHHETTSGFSPGETMKDAPASFAREACSTVRTVPAPTSISGSSAVMRRIASSAQAVRKVISARRQAAARKRLRKRDGPGGVLYFDDGNDSDFGNPFLQQFHILHIRFFHNSPCGIAATSFYH